MNKIYKVVWSKAKGCYVVASEFAKSVTKGCNNSGLIGKNKKSKLVVAAGILSLMLPLRVKILKLMI